MIRIVIAGMVLLACGSTPPPPPSGSTPPEAVGSAAPPPPAGCVRQRASHHFHCTGVDTGESNTYPVTVCDGCATSADCTARSGGTCASTGGDMCGAPAAFVCRYPNDVCDGCEYCSNDGRGEPVCSKRPTAPPAMDSDPEPPRQVPRPTRNDPRKAPKANAASCQADLEHCCMPGGAIEWLNGCCGGALPAYCSGLSGHGGDRGADGRCVGCQRKCLPATALIATPRGDREIATLAIGELVWTTTAGGVRIAAPIEALRSLPIEGLHELVVVTLDDGRRIRASAGHPTASAERLDALQPGDRVDGARVTDIAREPYLGAATWDLRPAGGTTYWADGVLLGTTLAR